MENPQLLDLILHGVAALLPGLFMAAAGLVRGGVLLTGLIVGIDPLWIGWPEFWGFNGSTVYFGVYFLFALFALVSPPESAAPQPSGDEDHSWHPARHQ